MNGVNDISFPNLGLYLKNIPDHITIFGITIKFYAIIIASAFIIAMLIAQKQAKKTNQDPEIYLDALLTLVIPCILGARIYYVIFSWDQYKNNLSEIFNIRNGGLGIYGGIIFGVITMLIFCKVKKVSFAVIVDTIAPGLVLGQMLGRWGNFFNREAFGQDTNSLFAMRLPVEHLQVTFSDKVSVHTPDSGLAYIQVQPTFLYESVVCLLVFVILLLLRNKKKFDGEVFLIYLFLYGCGRVVIEGFRTDQLILGTMNHTPIPVSQLLAGVLIVVSLVWIIVARTKAINKAKWED